jgi:hypothetical protein
MSEEVTEIEREVATEGDEPATNSKATSVLDGGDEGGGEVKGAPDWPEDWREKLAGDDEKFLAQLKRYASPQNFAKKTRALEQKLSSGEYKRQIAEGATPEEIAEWRKENGIPEKPDGYELPKVSGVEWSDDDKAIAQTYFEKVHGANASPGIVKASMEWYGELQLKHQAAEFERDSANKEKLEDALRSEWGPEYRANLTVMKRALEKDIPHGMDMAYARLPDGRRLIDSPDFCAWVTHQAREKYGDGGIISGQGAETLADRKKQIQTILREDPGKYYSDGLDKEYRDILEREHASQRRA